MTICKACFARALQSYALVAQLDRALDSDSKGRWFESSRARQKIPIAVCGWDFFMFTLNL